MCFVLFYILYNYKIHKYNFLNKKKPVISNENDLKIVQKTVNFQNDLNIIKYDFQRYYL